MNELFRPAASLGGDGFALSVLPEDAGWQYSSLRVLDLEPGELRVLDTEDSEVVVLALAGACEVDVDGSGFALVGRPSVFDGLSDFVYAPIESTVTVHSAAGGRFALAGARAERSFAPRRVAAEDIAVELRGTGDCSRMVVNFCTPGAFDADRLIACEVLTPAGNWSSYPPHKHDEETADESNLEEIYYFEIADGPDGPGVGFQRVYGTPERPIDVLAEVRTGDVVLVPHGWHGPTMAMPGFDLYFLNVMAGPGERAWRISFDPAYSWIVDTWSDQIVDRRLRMDA